ncbi:hypothetical protein NT6N_31350 [Oceaniferula spumae]|uniref:dihydroneopterin aldolase n=1 Tax=Oceaniferula spumae TaxID=2979115 RepID=A0AAT9FPY5_9BACT
MQSENSNDQIFIRGLVVTSYIGVPDEERANSQDLLVTAIMAPKPELRAEPLDDDISRTIDYHAVAVRIEEIAAERPRKLIETLAEDIAAAVLAEFEVASITVEIEKFIMPNTRCVGVITTRFAGKGQGN